MLVIMKALLSGYNIGSSTIHEAHNEKVLCLFAKAAYLDLFYSRYSIVQYAFFSDHSKSTMAAAGPARGELVPDMVNQ